MPSSENLAEAFQYCPGRCGTDEAGTGITSDWFTVLNRKDLNFAGVWGTPLNVTPESTPGTVHGRHCFHHYLLLHWIELSSLRLLLRGIYVCLGLCGTACKTAATAHGSSVRQRIGRALLLEAWGTTVVNLRLLSVDVYTFRCDWR